MAGGGGAHMNSENRTISRTILWVEKRRVLNYLALLLRSNKVKKHSYFKNNTKAE